MKIAPNSEHNIQQAGPFFAVANMEASLRFYVEGLGFGMASKWIDEGKLRWCWLQRGGAALMLQEFKKEGHDAWVPEGKVGIGVTICFVCVDALAFFREVTARDSSFTSFRRKWYVGGLASRSGWLSD